MVSIKMMTTALALATAGAAPVLAQDTMGAQSGSAMNSASMAPSGSMAPGTMSKSQMAAMKKCQAMSSDMMMKNKKCASMAKMHPEMMQGGSMPATN